MSPTISYSTTICSFKSKFFRIFKRNFTIPNSFKNKSTFSYYYSFYDVSIAGVPPLAGFIGKFYLFFAAAHSGIYLSVFVAIIVNVIGSFYYIRCIKLAYFDQSKE
jgi:NADH:ubiquinone oxidoreductase subunit 2 (subunit N)